MHEAYYCGEILFLKLYLFQHVVHYKILGSKNLQNFYLFFIFEERRRNERSIRREGKVREDSVFLGTCLSIWLNVLREYVKS